MVRFTGSLLSFITPRRFIKSYCRLCTNCSLRKQLLMSLGWAFQFSYYTSLFLWSPGRDWLDASWRCQSCVLFFSAASCKGQTWIVHCNIWRRRASPLHLEYSVLGLILHWTAEVGCQFPWFPHLFLILLVGVFLELGKDPTERDSHRGASWWSCLTVTETLKCNLCNGLKHEQSKSSALKKSWLKALCMSLKFLRCKRD